MFTPKANLLGGRRGSRSNTPLSGQRRTPLLTTRSRGTQGNTPVSRTSVIEDTGSNILSTYGSSLPVLVTEVLTLANAGEVTVSLSDNGWAWLVSGRRLVVWRYSGGGRAQCRELSLSPSDLKHRSDLCAVYSLTPSQTPCCVAVSPEGVVRYWPSIVHEGSSTDLVTELGGQECFSLTPILPIGCVLATTTSSLVLIYHGPQGVSCKHLQTSSNLLGGFGRRVSSLLWGSVGSAQGEAKLIRTLPTQGRDPDTKAVFVLTALGLQKWTIEDSETNRQIYDADLTEIIRESMWSALSSEGGEGKPSWLRVWPLDISVHDGEHINILVAGINSNENAAQDSTFKVHYGILTVKVITDAPPMRSENFMLLSRTSIINEGDEPSGLRLLSIDDIDVVIDGQDIQPIDLKGKSELPKLSLASTDSILGTGIMKEFPIFFTSHYGVLSLTKSQSCGRNDSMDTSDIGIIDKNSSKLSESLNISVSNQGLENLTMSESKRDQLKAAFLLNCKRMSGQAQSIIDELFPGDSTEDIDSSLDRTVVALSKDLIDDFPASDPRWMESIPASQVSGAGSTMSLLVLHQLEDKLACHELYTSFLKSVGLWSRLSAVTVRGKPMSSILSLAEHNEKNVAAVTLRTIHNDYAKVIDACMKSCLDSRDVTASGNLTAQDHFYREISRIDDILESFVSFLQLSARSESPRELVQNILAVNSVVVTVLKEVLMNRNKQVNNFTPTGNAANMEYLPWTAGRRTQLTHLYKLTLNHGLKSAEDSAAKVRLQQQILDIADIILDGYRSQVSSLEGNKKAELTISFEREREQLIQPLVDLKLYEQAASLAEKYLEFAALVRICEETKNKDKLDDYINVYANYNFSEFVFTWYVKEGKQSRLLASTGRSKELGRFLTGHTEISWLHDLHTSNLKKAALSLEEIASNETDILARKKVQLSLAKLAALGSTEEGDVSDLIDKIDQESMLVAAQEQIPRGVVEQFGLDHANMRVLSPREMIEMYIGEENSQADSIEFIKALELLNYVQLDEEEKEKVRFHIWCQSILRDSWVDIDTNNPIDSLKGTVFFRLVEYAVHEGIDLDTFLPQPESILEQAELGDLRKNANFQFLLQTGYEHVHRVCATA